MVLIEDGSSVLAGPLSTDALSGMSREGLIELVLKCKHEVDECKEEYNEYKATSMEMEKMLEMELEETRKKLRSTENEREGMRRELERTTTRSSTEKAQCLHVEENLRRELSSVTSECLAARERIRLLEQRNDDFERKERISEQLLDDLNKQLNVTMERVAFLESDLQEQAFTAESVARMREEARSERPRVAVEPLRMDRMVEHTPDETPENERKAFASLAIDDHMEVDDVHCPSTSSAAAQQSPPVSLPPHLPPTPESASTSPPPPSSKSAIRRPHLGFTHSINKIVRDLLVRVDRVENILGSLKTPSTATTAPHPRNGH